MKKFTALVLAGILALSVCSCSSGNKGNDTNDIPVITSTEPPAPVTELSYGIAVSNSTSLDIKELYAIDPDSGVTSENLLANVLYEWTSTPASLSGPFSSNVFDVKIVYIDDESETISNITINDGTTIDISQTDTGTIITAY